MVRKIVWRTEALSDLEAIKSYIAQHSLANAEKVVVAISNAADHLVDFPYAARVVPEFQDPMRRETFVHEYSLMYRIEDDCVRILRVVHGRRLLGNIPGSFEETAQEAYSAA
jgi:plasmid stabilization system protein ParE